MKLKIDENLPRECAEILRSGSFDADTVHDEGLVGSEDSLIAARCQSEGRALITLDQDFAHIGAYPPLEYAGTVVLRPRSQDNQTLLALIQRLVLVLT